MFSHQAIIMQMLYTENITLDRITNCSLPPYSNNNNNNKCVAAVQFILALILILTEV